MAHWPESRPPAVGVPLQAWLGYADRVSQVMSSARTRPRGSVAGGVARRALAVLLAAGVAALALGRGWLVCPVAALFSVPCPGCGLTRAALLLARGEWHGALRVHPLAPLLVPVVAFAAARAAYEYIGGPRLSDMAPRSSRAGVAAPSIARWRKRAALSLLGAVLAVWVLRFGGAFGGPVPVAILFER